MLLPLEFIRKKSSPPPGITVQMKSFKKCCIPHIQLNFIAFHCQLKFIKYYSVLICFIPNSSYHNFSLHFLVEIKISLIFYLNIDNFQLLFLHKTD